MSEEYDGYDDLNLKFDTPSILEAIEDAESAYEVELTLTGELRDGTMFEARDTIVLRGKPNWRWWRDRSSVGRDRRAGERDLDSSSEPDSN